ncbi:MAG TPA: hypothetical protein DCL15_15380, partial [Chloroflexi bacterium]|nr:hypothetical protein [Chloroflexota bacterium]
LAIGAVLLGSVWTQHPYFTKSPALSLFSTIRDTLPDCAQDHPRAVAVVQWQHSAPAVAMAGGDQEP